MRISLVEPFCAGSHQAWAEGVARHSRHEVELLTLPGRHWKWRMHGGALSLARRFLDQPRPDLLLATDMLDLTTFLALTRYDGPSAIYFHENQLTYPWSPGDPDPGLRRDHHFAFINFASALAADAVYFNSAYHRDAFLAALPGWLSRLPDHRELDRIDELAAKAAVLPLGLDLAALDAARCPPQLDPPLLIWNHRWEYDKNPDSFFHALFDCPHPFQLAVLGQAFRQTPPVFEEAQTRLADHILQWGHVASRDDYAAWLWRAALAPVTSHQDFFGASVVEALYCNTSPLLPDRLAYPEHLDSPAGLYPDDKAFAGRLHAWLADPRPDVQRDRVARYDWLNLILDYDRAFDTFS